MKGILFHESLFQLVVDGTKTQTRRLIKSETGYFNVYSRGGIITTIHKTDADGWEGGNSVVVNPSYKVGGKCYLKEPYIFDPLFYFGDSSIPCRDSFHKDLAYIYTYGMDTERLYSVYGDEIKWKNKLFMPESAARLFIEITGVRAERLQDISEEDCMKEGIVNEKNYFSNGNGEEYNNPVDAYSDLINSIGDKGTWERNPFVWVYDFKLV